MDGEFTMTSVTVDEAVAILLGWVDGPIVFRPRDDNLSQEEQDLHHSLTYSLGDVLGDDYEQALSDLAEAKCDKLDNSIIETRHKAVRETIANIALAKTYRCAIDDEINKGPMSALRVDVKRTNCHQTYITLTSFDAWAAEKGYRLHILEPVPATSQPLAERGEKNKDEPTVRRRQRDQEEAIVAEIKRIGYDPLGYPDNEPGRCGVKSEVWAALRVNELFKNQGVFEKAWQRARNSGDIAEKK